jgi:hypothetical protein
MIAPSRWSLRTDIPHRAAVPRATPTLHLEWHVGGVKVSRHGTVTAADLAKPKGGVLMFMSRGVLLPWSERGRG